MPLNKMIHNSETNLLRIIHYPPIIKNDDTDALRAAPHGDINLITILLSGSEPGLQVIDKKGIFSCPVNGLRHLRNDDIIA